MFEKGYHHIHRGKSKMSSFYKNRHLLLTIAVLFIGTAIIILNMYELQSMKHEHRMHHEELKKLPTIEAESIDQTNPTEESHKPVVWIQGSGQSSLNQNGRHTYLKHVHQVFERMGFSVGDINSNWVVMWGHDYPFVKYENVMKSLKPHQRINHFPGSGFITNKVSLAQTDMKFIPKAFEMPKKKAEFLEFSQKHPNMSWVQKSNKHRGIEIKDRNSLDLTKEGSFIQQYVSNPFLIDGHKFDIGVYTVITGIDPLRVYIVEGDSLFRFCPKKYYPFDDSVLDKYVVGDDYLPMWSLPSLRATFHDNEFTFTHSFNEYLRRKKIDANSIWDQMKSAIRDVVLTKERNLIGSMKKYTSKRNFFEMVRFDFVLDDKLNVFLMEANMSPNLSSDHFEQNSRLYEHVLYNMFGLVGMRFFTSPSGMKNSLYYNDSLLVTSKDIRVFPEFCESQVCIGSCKRLQCRLCKKCLTKSLETDIKIAYLEHVTRGSSRRIFPPSMTQSNALKWTSESTLLNGFNDKNKLMYLWFIGKCRLDPAWCH